MRQCRCRAKKGPDLSRILCKHSSVNCMSAPAGSQQGNLALPVQLGADQREAAGRAPLTPVLPLHLPPFPCHWELFGTARSGPGRAGCARRRKIFSGFEKIFWSAPWTARTVLEHGTEGKGAGVSGGPPLAGIRGSAPRTLPRALFARGIKKFFPCMVRLLARQSRLRRHFGRHGCDLCPLCPACPPPG